MWRMYGYFINQGASADHLTADLPPRIDSCLAMPSSEHDLHMRDSRDHSQHDGMCYAELLCQESTEYACLRIVQDPALIIIHSHEEHHGDVMSTTDQRQTGTWLEEHHRWTHTCDSRAHITNDLEDQLAMWR